MNRRISTKSWGGRRKRLCALALAFALAAGTVLAGLGAGPMTARAAEGTQTVYRLYNEANQEHLYTTDANEVRVLVAAHGWTYEGSAWEAPGSGTPVYRLYNQGLDNHLYTTDTNEIAVLTTAYGWVQDNDGNPLFYSGGDKDIYRLYNEPLRGMHLLSTDLNEYNTLAMPEYGGWEQEGAKLNCVELGNPKLPLPGEEQPAPTEPTPAPALDGVFKAKVDIYGCSLAYICEYDAAGNEIKVFGSAGDGLGAIALDRVYEYDTDGRMVKYVQYWVEYDEDTDTFISELGRIVIYEYDADGRCLKETFYDENNIVEYCMTYEYDGIGRLVKTVSNYSNGFRGVYTYKYETGSDGNTTKYEYDNSRLSNTVVYDPDGNEIKSTGYDEFTGEVTSYHIMEYDAKGNRTKWEIHDVEDPASSHYWAYEYDANGNMTKECTYKMDGTVSNSFRTYEYDASGNVIKQTFYNVNGTMESDTAYEYDAKGNMTKAARNYSADSAQSFTVTFEYNANGWPLKSSRFDANGNLMSEIAYYIR